MTVLTYNRIEITLEDMKCLRPREFLNDQIVNFYLEYLWRTYLSDEQRQCVYVCDTFFMAAIETSDGTRIQRWLKRINVMERDYLIIPVMMNEHWFIMILCHPKSLLEEQRHPQHRPKIHIMDSMEHYDEVKKREIIDALYKFVQAAAAAECNVKIENIRRRLPIIHADVFQQTNTYDCGICMLENAEHFIIENLHIPPAERTFQLSRGRQPRKRLREHIERLAEQLAIMPETSSSK